MAKPCKVTADEVDDVLVLIAALARYHMAEDTLCLVAPDYDAHGDDAAPPVFEELLVAVGVPGVLELIAGHNARRRDEPVVDSDAWNEVLATSVGSTLLSEAASHDAAVTPGPIWDVSLAVLFDL